MTGPVQRSVDVAAPRLVHLLAALLDHATPPWREAELPPLAHWLLFPPLALQSTLGPDGHPAREDAGLPRRMWAGSQVRFIAPIGLGSEVTRETVQTSVVNKTGRSGPMQFVTLRHRLSVGGSVCIEEDQDLVYREAAGKEAPASTENPLAAVPPLVRSMTADTVQLFRFSALTYNSHRIHYDLPYATQVEGYPALVVHGPYVATLLMDHFLRHGPAAAVKAFSFRARRPIFAGEPFTLGLTPDAEGGELVAIDQAGRAAVQARVDA
jgi:3-methylfumaryl-CoA hydratase